MLPGAMQCINYCNITAYSAICSLIMVAYMQVNLTKCKQFLRAVAPSGNLFLLLTLQELRRQGLTFIAFYALQRTIEYSGCYASALRQRQGWRTMRSAAPASFLPRANWS